MSYNIGGMKILNEYLALGTMGITGGLAAWASSGPSKPKQAAPEAAAGSANPSKEEDEFIKNFVAEFEKSEKEGK
ncbi:hypothetical protein E3P92_00801 [Wallemia ichthyophaga]|uniref:ATP synthase subunit K, mitochondrial n=1 Tax=Wallemia ichthyophaga TaxID=245174 RepID=A0A4T0IGK6_WALIC|nr:hypothetical protein E3P91_00410 [Wallemia ichthyophaga]TIA83453.1 hypothetical protein E3P98_00781 [Wallemia ichthyophaga]TIA93810.1 hypothetical protein E3P97_00706 [Wallemia ichthyophaga]TIB03075.1 hypothetical protein E3P95_00755 [Wallemia ichthyophaga]TIB03164.1 hypothetical protein E3P96_01967 [Wallemia ichthyophaga]